MQADMLLAAFQYATERDDWFNDGEAVAEIVAALRATQLGQSLRFAGPAGETLRAKTQDDFARLIANGRDGVFELLANKRTWQLSVQLVVVPGLLSVTTRLHHSEIAKYPTEALRRLVDLSIAPRQCTTVAGLLEGYLSPQNLAMASYAFERTRPRGETRNHGMLRPGAICDVFDPTFNASDPPRASQQELALIRSVPNQATRETLGDLLIQTWISRIDKKPALDAACEAHEAWFDQLLPTPALSVGDHELVFRSRG